MKYLWVFVCVSLAFSSCTCEIPKSMQDEMNKKVDHQIENIACQAQTRLANAFRFPIQELCNLKDDNCDGTIDEGLEELKCETNCGVGTMNCVEGKLSKCSAIEPHNEECNLIDDDCNGETDEQLSRFVSNNDCPSKKEVCQMGTWMCEDHYTITYCDDRGFVTAPAAPEPIKSWSYAVHTIETPTENASRTFTRVALTDDGMVLFENLYAADESIGVEWTFKDTLPAPMIGITAHAARYENRVLVAMEFQTKKNTSYAEWYLFLDGQMIYRDRQKPNEALPRMLATPMISGQLSLITYQMEVPGEGGVRIALVSEQIPHITPTAVSEIFESMDFVPYSARLYYEIPFVAWRLSNGSVACAVVEDETLHLLEEENVDTLSFIESYDPHIGLGRELEGSKEISIIAPEDSHSLVAVQNLPSDREHITIAQTSNGFAYASGVRAPLSEAEYSFVTIFIQGFSWERKLGKSEQPSARSVTVTQDLGGDTIMVLYDAEGVIRAHSFRCE